MTTGAYKRKARNGSVNCYICKVEVACRIIENHFTEFHKDRCNLCFFCGETELERGAGGRFTASVSRHLAMCCDIKKKEFRLVSKITKGRHSSDAALKRCRLDDCEDRGVEYPKIVCTKFRLGNGMLKEINSEVAASFEDIDSVLHERDLWSSSEGIESVMSGNLFLKNIDVVHEFWETFNFNLPDWLIRLTQDEPLLKNLLEFNMNSNIDTFWAKVFGNSDLDFHHVYVHLCVFENFIKLVRTWREMCTLLKYSCVCDKHGRDHVHFIMVSKRDARIQTRIHTRSIGECHITRDRDNLSRIMKQYDIRIEPSWPDHRHFHMKKITSSMHLFNAMYYISSRKCNPTKLSERKEGQDGVVVGGGEYIMENVKTPDQFSVANRVHDLIASYTTNLDYEGSHWHIYRPMHPHGVMWLTAVSRGGLMDYVDKCMVKRSLVKKFYTIEKKRRNFNSMEYQDIMEYLVQSAIPLCPDQIVFHRACQGNENHGALDKQRYIYLGNSEYVHLARNSQRPCCRQSFRDIFFLNQPHSKYKMSSKQHREIVDFFQIIYPRDERIRCLEDELKKSKQMCNHQNELRTKDDANRKLTNENRKLTNENRKLRHQLAHISSLLTVKKGPYLESNDKSNV